VPGNGPGQGHGRERQARYRGGKPLAPDQRGGSSATEQGREGGDDGARREDRAARPRESTMQIVVSWFSGLLLLCVAGFLVWEGTRPQVPAEFAATLGEVRESGDRFYLPLEIRNMGSESVQGLAVSLELRDGERVVERATATVDWLPEGSSRHVVLILDEDPRSFRRVVGFEGYQLP
jgi:uncharacterized protein (TIGR02588 family)